MNLRQVEFPAHVLRLDASTQWWDADTECTLLLARPQDEPELWNEYLAGAERSYCKHGVECALDLDEIRDGSDTVLFFVAIDDTGRIVSGVRAKGRCAMPTTPMPSWSGTASPAWRRSAR